jgi:TPR repeat protein
MVVGTSAPGSVRALLGDEDRFEFSFPALSFGITPAERSLQTMTEEPTEFDMALGSGIAAFETRQFARAAGLLSPLADAGNPQAQYRIAIMAQNGLGMHENHLLAFRYMKAAAEAGLDIAQHGLGFMYMEGECTEKDPAKAVHWLTKAAEQGLIGSQTTLAMMYEEGRGVEKDQEEANKWYRMAGFEER